MSLLLENIKRIPKEYFSIVDIRKVSTLPIASLRVALSRLVKQGRIIKLGHGWYTSDISRIDFERLAMDVCSGGYISFESVLAKSGVLSQQPMTVTVATRERGRNTVVGGRSILYRHIRSALFFGYEKIGNVFVADTEKAFLDLAYLSLNGYARFDVEEIDLSLLDRGKIREYLKKIDSVRLSRLVEGVLIHSKNIK